MAGIGAPTGKAIESSVRALPDGLVESAGQLSFKPIIEKTRGAAMDVMKTPFATVWNMCTNFGSRMLSVGGEVLKAPLRVPWIPQR